MSHDNVAVLSYNTIIIIHNYLRFIILCAVIICQSAQKVKNVLQGSFSELEWSGRIGQTPADLRNVLLLELIVVEVSLLLI